MPDKSATQKSPKNQIPLMSKFIIFSVTLFLIILVAGSAAFIFSMRQIIKANKGLELSQMLDSERVIFETFVNNELAIALRMADSPLIQRYFMTPFFALERMAVEELGSFRNTFASGTVFWVKDMDKRFYYNGEFLYIIDPESPENYWYNITLYETEIYNFNLGYNPTLGATKLWINVPVFGAGRQPLGIVGTGIEISDLPCIVNRDCDGRVHIYYFNASGEITSAQNTALIRANRNIEDELGIDIIAYTRGLYPGETRILDTSQGIIVIGTIPLLEWYSVALMPDSIHDYRNPLTILFLVMLVVIFLIFVIFNVFIADLLRPLRRSMDEAQAANRAKSAFLSSMSHEMRTPMNAIIGMATIGKHAMDIERVKYTLDKIEHASTHLLGIINNVLDMSKIEAGKLELSPVEFDFEKMLQKVISVINFRVDEKRQRLSLKMADNVPQFIVADDQYLAQVFVNLLSNAVKFTPEQGEISIDISSAWEKDGICELRTEIADSGIGISPKQQKRLFQMFEQAESSISRAYGGTGLGLAISKRIIELMGGKIWVESELGQGARFIFTVHVARVSNNLDSMLAYNDETSDADTEVRFDGKKLLLAEDIEINREILTSLLDDTGLIIDCAQDGQEALDMIKAYPDKYDLVFMDIQMPKMDGLEATRQIRALHMQREKRLPIVAMTANVFKSDIDKCLAAGMDDHLGKPIDINEVLEKLRKYL